MNNRHEYFMLLLEINGEIVYRRMISKRSINQWSEVVESWRKIYRLDYKDYKVYIQIESNFPK